MEKLDSPSVPQFAINQYHVENPICAHIGRIFCMPNTKYGLPRKHVLQFTTLTVKDRINLGRFLFFSKKLGSKLRVV